MLQEGIPLSEPEGGLLSNTWNELFKEIHLLTDQETLGRGTRVEDSRVREHRRTALPRGWQSWILW